MTSSQGYMLSCLQFLTLAICPMTRLPSIFHLPLQFYMSAMSMAMGPFCFFMWPPLEAAEHSDDGEFMFFSASVKLELDEEQPTIDAPGLVQEICIFNAGLAKEPVGFKAQ